MNNLNDMFQKLEELEKILPKKEAKEVKEVKEAIQETAEPDSNNLSENNTNEATAVTEIKTNSSSSMEVQTVEDKENKGDTTQALTESRKKLFQTSEVKQAIDLVSKERIHSDLEHEAADIDEQNTENKEKLFKNKKKKREIDRQEQEDDLIHKYKMSQIRKDAKHKQMLDKRKKMVEKYGYLYSFEKTTKGIDSDGKEYIVPENFTYSTLINMIRTFTRNINGLDTTVKRLITTVIWGALIFGGVALLRGFGVFQFLAGGM